eukprot:GHVN01101536.1.p1 GENE.GHVN01101536.1~~GHVN01101536.1.p1  ORF type:complete len:811 (+),score=46.96 GHVN01101536.1:295-2433(+)
MLKSRGDRTADDYLQEIREIVEAEVKAALNSENREDYSLKIQAFETWFFEVYMPMRDSGIIHEDVMAITLYDQIVHNLIPAQDFFAASSSNDPDRPQDCLGLYIYTTMLRVLCYQELFALSETNNLEGGLSDPNDPVLRRNLYTDLIETAVNNAHAHYETMRPKFTPILYRIPHVKLLVENLDLVKAFIDAEDGQAIYPASYALIKEKMDEGSMADKLQVWDPKEHTANKATSNLFSFRDNGIEILIPGSYLIRGYMQEPDYPQNVTIGHYNLFIMNNATRQTFWPGDFYRVESHRHTSGSPQLIGTARRRNIEQIARFGVGDVLHLYAGTGHNPDQLNAMGFAIEMPRLEEAFYEKWLGDFRNAERLVDQANPAAASHTRVANWGESEAAETDSYTEIDEFGRGIKLNRSLYPFDIKAKLTLKTTDGSPTEVRLFLVASKNGGEIVDLSQLLDRSDLEVITTISNTETKMTLDASNVTLPESGDIITLQVEANTTLTIASGDIQMEVTDVPGVTRATVSVPEMMRRDDGLSSYTLVQNKWELNNLDADVDSGRRPNDYLSNLADLGATLDVDIALDYVASVSVIDEIIQDSTDVHHYVSLRSVLFEHVDGQKNMIASRQFFTGKTAAQITPSFFGVVGAQKFEHEGKAGAAFSVEIYSSHKMRLGTKLLTLPVNDSGNLPLPPLVNETGNLPLPAVGKAVNLMRRPLEKRN